MTYYLHPLNEGQSMNCVQPFKANKADAIRNAAMLATMLGDLLPACTITVAVCKRSESPDFGEGIIVRADGTTVKP